MAGNESQVPHCWRKELRIRGGESQNERSVLEWNGGTSMNLGFFGVFLCGFFFLFFFSFFFCLFRAPPVAYGGSQARGLIGSAAASLHHRRSNARSELRLPSTPQLTATLYP